MQLLFEKLTDPVPCGQQNNKGVKAQIMKSVQRQLECILATQNYFNVAEGNEANVLSFGIPRLVDFDARSTDDLAMLTNQIERAIRSFEPRLLKPRLEIKSEQADGRVSCFYITGLLNLVDEVEQVTFPLTEQLTML